MKHKKLDLILATVSDIRAKINELDAKTDKMEVKPPNETISRRLDRLEDEIILNRTENLNHRKRIKELEMRLTQLEKKLNLTV